MSSDSSYFPQITGFDMKCQIMFSHKMSNPVFSENEKSITNLSSAEGCPKQQLE